MGQKGEQEWADHTALGKASTQCGGPIVEGCVEAQCALLPYELMWYDGVKCGAEVYRQPSYLCVLVFQVSHDQVQDRGYCIINGPVGSWWELGRL